MTITLSEVEAALVSFGGGLVGYLSTVGMTLGQLDFEHGAIVGAVAAFSVLGYSALTQGVSAPASAAPAAKAP